MAQDHQLTFDWILYVILMPWVVLALFELWRTRKDDERKKRP